MFLDIRLMLSELDWQDVGYHFLLQLDSVMTFCI